MLNHDGRGLEIVLAERHAGAAEQIVEAVKLDETGQAGPEHGDRRALSKLGRDAGPADLQETALKPGDRSQVEFALGVEATDTRGVAVRQDPRAADDLAGARIAHQEVLAVGIEIVYVQSARARLQLCAQLLAEDPISEGLGLADLRLGRGELDEEAFLALGDQPRRSRNHCMPSKKEPLRRGRS